jgi:hypothetical protein
MVWDSCSIVVAFSVVKCAVSTAASERAVAFYMRRHVESSPNLMLLHLQHRCLQSTTLALLSKD